MHVDATLIVRGGVGEVVGEAQHARCFMAALGIEIGIAAARIDGAVTKTEIGQSAGAIGAKGNIAGDVSHVVIHPLVPTHSELGIDVAEAGHGVGDAVGPGEWQGPHGGLQRALEGSRDGGVGPAHDAHQADGGLTAQKRICEDIRGQDHGEVGGGVQARVETGVEIGGHPAQRELARKRHLAARRNGGVIAKGGQRPSGLLRRGRHAPEQARQPEAHAALVRARAHGWRAARGREREAAGCQRPACRSCQHPHRRPSLRWPGFVESKAGRMSQARNYGGMGNDNRLSVIESGAPSPKGRGASCAEWRALRPLSALPRPLRQPPLLRQNLRPDLGDIGLGLRGPARLGL